ncbi:fused MFS/spermidine synthase [Prosthecobacter sp.]|uniref:fused MFS/spermidine synthase n=1 Tax=Prosthecobacter sp. TaxID=1965333 RepID=UPI002489ABC1|nr:fused MFS/spermidine synthase [Prosthecobacter sp.]MDI1313771.1 fused MFS/spermidine synthase [Prosthecobacter sp.]
MPSTPAKSPMPSEVEDASARKTRLFLGLVCFFAGAAIMVVEISAFRLLAPYFGNTIYTSTALIGVILVAFSVGGYLGGHLADRKPALDLIGWLLGGAAVLTLFIPALHMVFSLSLSAFGVITGPLLISLVLFALPGVLLGAVSPASVRFYSLTQKDTHVGAAAGTISMLGSLGSFVGTFVSGFFLLSTFGVRGIFVGAGAVLLLLAVASFILARNAAKVQVLIAGLIAGVVGWTSEKPPLIGLIHERESVYHHISVFEEGEAPNRRRLLALDSTQEGGINPDTGELILPYQEYWKLALLREPAEVSSALFIGAGAFGMPEKVSRDFPKAAVDVVEIDPQVIDVGRKFFKLDEHPRVNAHAADARQFLRLADRKWDLIFGDAYNGRHAIPSHLATREFFQLVADHLEPRGVYVMNIIAAVSGRKADLTAGMVATLRQVFPSVEVFGVGYRRDEPQNVILLCSRENVRALIQDRYVMPGSWQEKLIRTLVPAGTVPRSEVVFTDNYNPVDAIIARGLLE